MKVEDVNKKIAIFSKYLIAQNQSFAQKEVGQNIYSFKRASIWLFLTLPHI